MDEEEQNDSEIIYFKSNKSGNKILHHGYLSTHVA